MIKIDNRIKYVFLTGFVFSVFAAMQITYNLSNTGITFNPLYAFDNLYLLLGCISFGTIPAIMLILNNLETLGKDNRNYSKLVNVNYFKENFNKIIFNQNAEIVENRQLFLTNDIRTQINIWTKEHKLEFLKIPLSKQNLGFGIFFVTGKNYVYVDNADHHTLIIGTTGSGKSFSFILPMLCLLAMTGESGLCVDIKGELSKATAELFKSKGYRVYFLDFIEPQNSDCWNPLYLGSHEYMKQLKTKNEQENYLKNKLEKGKEEFEILHGNVAVLEEKKEDDQEMKEENERQIIKNEIYSSQELSQDFLNNKLFYKCHFVDCSVSDNVKLNATTDFKECTFLNNDLHFDDVDKTSFDDCIFEKVSLKGNFIHASFAGSKFSNLSFIRDSTFVACLFDHTNAIDYFDNNLIKLSNIELVKKSNDNTEILKKVNELYEILKSEDKVLQQELIAKTKVDEEDVLDYILHLDDMEYLKLIAKTSSRVVEEKMV